MYLKLGHVNTVPFEKTLIWSAPDLPKTPSLRCTSIILILSLYVYFNYHRVPTVLIYWSDKVRTVKNHKSVSWIQGSPAKIYDLYHPHFCFFLLTVLCVVIDRKTGNKFEPVMRGGIIIYCVATSSTRLTLI